MSFARILVVTFTIAVLAAAGWAADTSPYGTLVPVKIKGIAVDPRNSKPIAVLETTEETARLLPIWIGPFEANAITMQMEEVPTVRPLTHDLIKNILKGLDAKVERVIITKLEKNIFYAVIRLEVDGREITVDSRPSDAMAVALRVNAPIYATEQVLKDAKTIETLEGQEPNLAQNALGITVQELTPAIAEHFSLGEKVGVLVSHVQSNSRAASAGIRRGDIITAIGDHSTDSIQAFQEAIEAASGQTQVDLRLHRGDGSHDLILKLNSTDE
ncbi:MAG: DUF151 domain-containing protein [bacterium]|nr:DUF151 domain-containing protein [bacterium]